MNQCTAIHGFYRCQLQSGHESRHRDGSYTWLDQSVANARAAKQHAIQAIIASACRPYVDNSIEPERFAYAASQILLMFGD